jgi:arsenite-transporting ATPase
MRLKVPNLEVTHVDAAAAFKAWLAPRKDLLTQIALRGTYLDAEDVQRLLALSLPGIDEVAALLEILRVPARGDAQVVIDTAPTGHTLRLLAMPALSAKVAGVLNLMQSHHRGVVTALTGRYREDAADRLIESMAADARELMSRLREPRATCFVWVTLAEPMALEETADALDDLTSAGISVRSLVINRAAAPGGCAWDAARRRFEARALAPVASRFRGVELRTVPELPDEPRNAAALTRLSAACHPVHVHPTPSAPAARLFGDMGPGSRSSTARTDTFDARWLLFGGKGGVGKTTCSAAAAVALAAERPGDRFLLISTDPAHSLGDAFGVAIGDTPRTIPGAPANLEVREIDARVGLARFRERYLATVDAMFAGLTRGAMEADGDRGAFRELIDLAPPGVDEVMAIADVAELLAGERPYRTVVTDTAPTGHALRLVETPAVLRDWTRALMAILLKYREIIRVGEFAQLLVDLSGKLRSLETILRDRSSTAFVLVTRAASLPREETGGFRDALARLGVPIRAVIVNAVGAGSCARCRAVARRQQAELRTLTALARRGRYAIIETPSALPPPHGADALRAWRSRWRAIEP